MFISTKLFSSLLPKNVFPLSTQNYQISDFKGFNTHKILSPIADVSQYTVRSYSDKKEDCYTFRKPLDAKKFKPVSHVIFDLEGTVVDSEGFTVDAHAKFLAKYKKKFSHDLIKKTMGLGELEAAKIIVNNLEMDMKPEIYAHGVWQIQRELFLNAKLKPGAKDLICHFSNNKIPIALTTGSGKRSFQFKTKNTQTQKIIRAFCHIVIGGDDPAVKRKLPEPDVFLVAASRFPDPPKDLNQVLVINDSPSGINAAKAAGMQVVMLKDKRWPWEESQEVADVVVNHLNEFKPELFDLPKTRYYE